MRAHRQKLLLFVVFSIAFWGVACLIMPFLPVGICGGSKQFVIDCEIPIAALTLLVIAALYLVFAVRFWRSKISGIN